MRRAVFLDRDGVVIEDVDYLRRPDQIKLLPGAARAIVRLRRAGFKIVVVSNQSGVARGYLTETGLRRIHRELRRKLGSAKLDAVYYCPHHPQGSVARYRRRCACRKPGTGMLKAAAERFGLDLSRCWMVGDKDSDIAAGKRAGCRTIRARTGKSGREPGRKADADRTCRDLAAAARWILTTSP